MSRRLRALTPTESQQVFRSCLDALAHPGRVVPLPTDALPHDAASAAMPMLALTDLMTPVAGLDDDESQLRQVAIVTGAPVVAPPQARWVLATSATAVRRFRELSTGTALHPERGAVVCLQVDGFSSGQTLRLRGPGVDGQTELQVRGLPDGFVAARDELLESPPCGVDFLLVCGDAVAALPRTTNLTIENVEPRTEVTV